MSYSISFRTDNKVERSEEGLKANMSFSTEFCYLLLCRKNITENSTKIHQIEKLINFDISPFYDIEHDIEFEVNLKEIVDNSDKIEIKNKCLEEIKDTKKRFEEMQDNLTQVLDVVTKLKKKLSESENIKGFLKPTDFNTFAGDDYFLPQSKVNIFKDLGLLINFLKAAEKKQASTVWYECH